MRLTCPRCDKDAAWGRLGSCPGCSRVFEIRYDQDRADWPEPDSKSLNAYRAILPVRGEIVTLGEGDTPLIASRRLGHDWGLNHLYFKNEGLNPSGAFKDRVAALALTLARESGKRGILTASSGNSAAAMATHAAANQMDCVVLVETESPASKIRQILAMGATVVRVEDLFAGGPAAVADLLERLARALHLYLAFAWAPVNPYLLEGIKPLSLEIIRDLGSPPDILITPVGGGDLLTGQWRGYKLALSSNRSHSLPRLIGAQSEAAPPLLTAFRGNLEQVPVLPTASSVVSGLNVPFSGDHALQAIRESGGTAEGAADEEILETQRLLAEREGIWCEPAGAAAVAVAGKLARNGSIQADERVVCVVSGAGFKDRHLASSEAREVIQVPAVHCSVDEILQGIRAVQ